MIASPQGVEERVDDEFIFGFTIGADAGELGENELEHQTAVQCGKRDGRDGALTDRLRYETSLDDQCADRLRYFRRRRPRRAQPALAQRLRRRISSIACLTVTTRRSGRW